jgi:cell division protein ZapA
MAQVTISINSREYAIACEDGQELRIMQLSRILDEKAKLLTDGTNQISESMLLAMVGLLLADEITELKKGKAETTETSTLDLEKLNETDAKMAETINILTAKLKVLAKEINLL